VAILRSVLWFVALLFVTVAPSPAQNPDEWISGLPQAKDYIQKRSSSYDRTGGNADYRPIAPGQTLTVLNAEGPAIITHIWMTISSQNPAEEKTEPNLKALVLRMYWDGEATPSVEAPIGDFFGLGLGEYHSYNSLAMAVAPQRALNCFLPMPFQKNARITVTNEGSHQVGALYFNIDYRAYAQPLAGDQLYFHAQYRQATPNKAVVNEAVDAQGSKLEGQNLNGENNYVWMTARGRGHFVGVTMSILENKDGWWGEGDDMFFIDGETRPSINGTGTEDYFLGAYDFGGTEFSYPLFGAPVVGKERLGEKWSVYHFHLDSPIPFTRSLKATIEHGHANDRADNYYSVAYWYQTEPHAAFPALPTLKERIVGPPQ
jgi:hypothetical protein